MSFLRDATIVLALFLFGFAVTHHLLANKTGPVINIESISAVRPIISKGDPLEIRVRGEYLRLCPIEWHPQLIHTTSGRVVWRDTVHGGGRTLGPFPDITFSVFFPETVAPGRYVYRTTGFADCDGNEKAPPVAGPDVDFTIVTKFNE